MSPDNFSTSLATKEIFYRDNVLPEASFGPPPPLSFSGLGPDLQIPTPSPLRSPDCCLQSRPTGSPSASTLTRWGNSSDEFEECIWIRYNQILEDNAHAAHMQQDYARALCFDALTRSFEVDAPTAGEECVLLPRIAAPSAAKENVQPSGTTSPFDVENRGQPKCTAVLSAAKMNVQSTRTVVPSAAEKSVQPPCTSGLPDAQKSVQPTCAMQDPALCGSMH
jgi:hypothetical protein